MQNTDEELFPLRKGFIQNLKKVLPDKDCKAKSFWRRFQQKTIAPIQR
jgi:hypothetical protein